MCCNSPRSRSSALLSHQLALSLLASALSRARALAGTHAQSLSLSLPLTYMYYIHTHLTFSATHLCIQALLVVSAAAGSIVGGGSLSLRIQGNAKGNMRLRGGSETAVPVIPVAEATAPANISGSL